MGEHAENNNIFTPCGAKMEIGASCELLLLLVALAFRI